MEATMEYKEKVLVAGSLEAKVLEVKKTVGWHFGLSEDEVFEKILDAGEYYLQGRVKPPDYKAMIRNKGFWHWFEQVYCMNVTWLIRENGWEAPPRPSPKGRENPLINPMQRVGVQGSKDYFYFERILRARIDAYSFEPVLIAMYRGREYDGRVFW